MTHHRFNALKAAASGLILAAAIGAAGPAFAQDFPPNIGPDGQPAPTTPLGGNGQPVTAPGMNRPMLQKTAMVAPPAVFCSEREKLDWLLEVFYPAAQKATKNNIAAHDYKVRLHRLIEGSSGSARDAYEAELAAWTPIWQDAEQLASAFLAMLDAIHDMPVVDCGGVAAAPAVGVVGFAAKLQAARDARPTAHDGGGEWGVIGETGNLADIGFHGHGDRPFDGSEAERDLRQRLVAAQDSQTHTHVRPHNPQPVPPTVAPTEVAVVTPTAPPVEEPTGLVTGPSVFDDPADEGLPPPSVPGATFVDPPAAEPAPGYPDCPTHPGMPGTPEHVLEFHS